MSATQIRHQLEPEGCPEKINLIFIVLKENRPLLNKT